MSQRKRGGGRGSLNSVANTSQAEDMEVDEDYSMTNTQTATQLQRNMSKRSTEQVDRKVAEVVQYLLVKDQKKMPIKRADSRSEALLFPQWDGDSCLGGLVPLCTTIQSGLVIYPYVNLSIFFVNIIKNVVKEYKDVYSEIVNRAGKALQKVFGLQLAEIDTKNHVYILINTLERLEGDKTKMDDSTAKLGLLTVILSLIFMKGNVAKEAVIWETLRKLQLDPAEKDSEFGDLKKLVTEEFVRQRYLEYNRIPHTDPVEHELRWGARALKETSKMKILEFVSKIQNKDPKSWTSQYKEAQAEATPAGALTPHFRSASQASQASRR